MDETSRWLPTSATRQLCALAAWTAAMLTVFVQPLGAQASASTVVLEYTHIHHMLAEHDPVPLIRVYADGRVLIHHPAYMAAAGDYELRLTARELADLFSSFESEGLMDVDVDAGWQEREVARESLAASSGELTYRSDTMETWIRVRGAVDPSGVLAANSAETFKEVRWPNVFTDAQRYPGIEAVQVIASAEEKLAALLERDDLVKLP